MDHAINGSESTADVEMSRREKISLRRARARKKKFFFFLTRFVEQPGDVLGLVCSGNAATPDRLQGRSPQFGCIGEALLQKRFGLF